MGDVILLCTVNTRYMEIIGIKLDNRIETAVEFQKIITSYGCDIRTRLGLHETDDWENFGIILLEYNGKSSEKLISELSKIWYVQIMSF